jgi:flagellar hook-basal body complex protein FliE
MIKNINNISQMSGMNQPKDAVSANSEIDFAEVLKKSIDETNVIQKEGEQALADIATGQVKDLHQAAIAINKAATSMKFMLEVRNKAVNAYKEILKTQM